MEHKIPLGKAESDVQVCSVLLSHILPLRADPWIPTTCLLHVCLLVWGIISYHMEIPVLRYHAEHVTL